MTVAEGLFFCLKPAELAVVVQAVIKIGGRALKNRAMYVIAAGAFVAIFFFNVPFPIIIISAAIIGFLGHRWWPNTFLVIKPRNGDDASDDDSLLGEHLGAHTQPSLAKGAYREPGAMNPFVAGTLTSVLVTWVTFVPCFLWIFLGGPYIESLRRNERLSAALSAINAAVVGVIMNLALWLAIHTLFREVEDFERWGMRVPVPDLASMDLAATAIGVIAVLLQFWLKRGMITTLIICAGLGVMWTVAAPAI